MHVALIGSVSSSWYTLEALIRGGVEVTGVLGVDESRAEMISDYRSLRGLAASANLPFHSMVKVTEPGVADFLQRHRPDLLWVIGISQLVPQALVDLARYGGVGFHPTMLPQGRGRAPVAWTILLDQLAAATLFFLTDEADAGDIIMQREVPVLPDDYSVDLIERTNRVLARMVLELAPAIKAGKLPRTPQDHSQATYYEKRTPVDGLIDWSRPTDKVYKLIRAAGRPYPGAFSHAGGRKVTIWRAKPVGEQGTARAEPGTVLAADANTGFVVATGDSAIRLTEVQAEGDTDARSLLAAGVVLTKAAQW